MRKGYRRTAFICFMIICKSSTYDCPAECAIFNQLDLKMY